MAARDLGTALADIASKPWAEYDAEVFTPPVDPPAWSGGSDLPPDWVARNNARNAARNYVYKVPAQGQRHLRLGSRRLPRPVRQRRRVRRVAGQPTRRAASRSPGREPAEPALALGSPL